MGGDQGPIPVVAGMARVAKKDPDVTFVVHGNKDELKKRLKKYKALNDRYEIKPTTKVISMDTKPSTALRNGRDSSMWSTIETLRTGLANVAISCGNTGALMATAMLNLKKAPGVSRPAIACLCPSPNASGFNVLLDVGADIKANEKDLLCYSIMGSKFAQNGLQLNKPRIGLLNVGTESHKGRSEIKAAYDLISGHEEPNGYEFVGFVEGTEIFSDRVDVIVTDGFTGNTAIKSSEGAARVIRNQLRQAFAHTLFSRIGGFFAYTSLRRFFKRIDPRRANGGVFLGLNGIVIKSHGGSDAVGIEAAIDLGVKLARSKSF